MQLLWLALTLVSMCAIGCGSRPPAQAGAPQTEALAPIPVPARAPSLPEPPALRLPDGVRPVRAELRLDIDPELEAFSGRVRYTLALAAPTRVIWLNATGLDIGTASIDGTPARVHVAGEDFVGFELAAAVGPGTATLDIEWQGTMDSVKSQGLYRVREPDGAYHAYTFFQTIDARRAFPCFDEPQHKIPWTLQLAVPSEHVALANAPVAAVAPEREGWQLVTFAESKPLPSYLVAFVVGPFELVDGGTAGRNHTQIRFVIPRGRAGELRWAREVTPRVVGLLEDYFGSPYPFEKLDVAVVPRFWGTMEHPGLVAMGQPLTLIKPGEETEARRRDYANILIHELAHYWFGNLVTLRWWDETWLNEGLTAWIDAKLTMLLEPAWRWETEVVDWTTSAMEADAQAASRPVVYRIQTRQDIGDAFDNGLTYAKGAALARMFEAWLGPERFQRAVRGYLAERAWQSATTADFLAALAAEAPEHPGVAEAFQGFLTRPGVPIVSAELVCEASGARVRLTQERFLSAGSAADSEPWQIPVCLGYDAGRGRRGRACTLLASTTDELVLPGTGCPRWIFANDGATGYYRTAFRAADLQPLLRAPLTLVEKLRLVADVRALAEAQRLPLGNALALVPQLLRDPDPAVALSTLMLTSLMRRDLLGDADDAHHTRFVTRVMGSRARGLRWIGPDDEPEDRRSLRLALLGSLAATGAEPRLVTEARTLVLHWLEDRGAVPAHTIDAVLLAATRAGDAGLFERLLAAAQEAGEHSEKARLYGALGSFIDPALNARALALVIDPAHDARDTSSILMRSFFRSETQQQAWAFLRQHWDTLLARRRPDEVGWMLTAPRRFCSRTARDEVAAFFAERAQAIEGGPRLLAGTLEEIDLCVERAAGNRDSVRAFLSRF